MKQMDFFGDAKWMGAKERARDTFSVLYGKFTVADARKVSLHILGLGFFKCYINGKCINPDTFLPLSSDFEASCDPKNEVLAGHRVYVPQFDITSYVKNGENTIAVHFGGGWYTFPLRVYGLPKAIYRITVLDKDGERDYCSNEQCLIGKSFVDAYWFTKTEVHRLADMTDMAAPDFENCEPATAVEALETTYCQTDCPCDGLIGTIPPRRLGDGEAGIVYDCGENTVGYPVLRVEAKAGETVTVRFSEGVLPDGKLDMQHHHEQVFSVIGDGTVHEVQPEFTWFGFRYFEVIGDAQPLTVKIVHAKIEVTSRFESDNETLNWIYNTFIHTMLCNMHTGHPSDCPHLERLGYTGDGQLTCHAVLSTMDAKAFYEKWLQDIADCQDTLSGHVQYTAPHVNCGGGPGGWGSAIVEVPYQMYRHYGDTKFLTAYYENMRKYIEFLEDHSEFGLVTSDVEGAWCLGDWCGPVILYPDKDISFTYAQQIFLPAPMVNTYFLVRSLRRMSEIAHVIGRDEDVAAYEEKAARGARAIHAAYFNTFDGNFVMNAQGANAFAVDIGVGDDRTYANLLHYYKMLGYYDTGIFGTDILTRVLFERGEGALAVDLLAGDGEQGFEQWRKNGATTLHEYWDSVLSRSHSHPMFGSPVAYFFEYLLGIRQRPGTAGYVSLVIEPQAVSKFGRMSGSMRVPNGDVAVAYQKTENGVDFAITVPAQVEAVFRYNGAEYPLQMGANTFIGL